MRGTQEVAGSSPASSTSYGRGPITVGCNKFRDHLGYWVDRVAAGEQVTVTRRGKPRITVLPAAQPAAVLPLTGP